MQAFHQYWQGRRGTCVVPAGRCISDRSGIWKLRHRALRSPIKNRKRKAFEQAYTVEGASGQNCRPALEIKAQEKDEVSRYKDFPAKGLGILAGVFIASLSPQSAGVAQAAIHAEPDNALSIPTWVIHISSVIEWTTAMILMWQYAKVTGNEKWKGMTWGMMPLFAGALTACTYHFFYNSPDLDFLVAIQAALTWIGNATLWLAAYRIFKDTKETSPS